jgi:ribosomal protein S18 acetylase RimI-like enzyme
MDLKQNALKPLHLNSSMIRSPKTPKEWDSYYDLRYIILRAPWNQARGSERNEGDETAQHFAFFDQESIVGVGRLDIMPNNVGQIRFMAVSEQQQGTGIGKKLMLHMEVIAKELRCNEIILHAREIAIPFYEKLDYTITEKSHLLFNEIQHFLMHKKI